MECLTLFARGQDIPVYSNLQDRIEEWFRTGVGERGADGSGRGHGIIKVRLVVMIMMLGAVAVVMRGIWDCNHNHSSLRERQNKTTNFNLETIEEGGVLERKKFRRLPLQEENVLPTIYYISKELGALESEDPSNSSCHSAPPPPDSYRKGNVWSVLLMFAKLWAQRMILQSLEWLGERAWVG